MEFRELFIGLSENKSLNALAKKYGLLFGAKSVVGGENIPDTVETIKKLNAQGIEATVDNLGEFVDTKEIAERELIIILNMIDAIQEHNLKAHMSIKLTQLGLEFDKKYAMENLRKILLKASKTNMHINIDTESYRTLADIQSMIDEVKHEFSNVGTVIQCYLYDAEEMIEKYPDLRLRLVKGAYNEDDTISFQSKKDIDENYIKMIKKRLLNANNITSIATHDHNIINEIKQFVKDHDIDKDQFEFQMLYGFRTEMHKALVDEGYNFCVYIPFGKDWFAYFMRRLAERPQNLDLVIKSFVKKDTVIKVGSAVGLVALSGYAMKKVLDKKDQ